MIAGSPVRACPVGRGTLVVRMPAGWQGRLIEVRAEGGQTRPRVVAVRLRAAPDGTTTLVCGRLSGGHYRLRPRTGADVTLEVDVRPRDTTVASWSLAPRPSGPDRPAA